MRSIAGGAIDRSLPCVRSSALRSILGPCQLHVCLIVGVAFDRTTFDCTRCDRSQITTFRIPTVQVLKRWSIGLARATWGTQVYVVALDCRSCIRSHLQGPKFYLRLISPLLAINCTNVLQHKILDINTAKSLMNIS